MFAQGQSEPTTQPQTPTVEIEAGKNGGRSIAGTIPKRQGSASEEALSRQLDGDLGGKLMGLRSRRSSAATTNTLNTPATAGTSRHCSGGNGIGRDSPRKADELGAATATGSISIIGDDERGRGGSMVASPLSTVAEPGVSNEGGADASNGNLAVPTPSLKRGGDPMSGQGERLGKKASSSWLRWTSPTPSFPKQGEDKGQAKAEEIVEDQSPESANEPQTELPHGPAASTATSSDLPSDSQTVQPSQQATTPIEPLKSAGHFQSLQPEQNPSRNPTGQSQTPPLPGKEEKQGWFRSFSRNPRSSALTSLHPSQDQVIVESIRHGSKQGDEVKDLAKPSEIEGSAGFGAPVQSAKEIKTKEDTRKQVETGKSLSTSASPNPPLAEGEVRPDVSSLSNSSIPSYTVELAAESTSPSSTVTHAQGQSQQKKTVHPQQSMASLRGFRDYLGWTGSNAEGREISSKKGEDKGSASNSGADDEQEARAQDVIQTSEETRTPTQSTETTETIAPTPKGQPGPWSSYLYSFVVPEPKQGQAQSSKRACDAPESENNLAAAVPLAQPTDTPKSSTEPQPALFTPLTTPSNTMTTSRNVSPAKLSTAFVPAPGSTSAHPSAPSSSASPSTSRRSSAAGWLNYLAFRANQKKITAGSVNTGGTDEGEVMDFSNDPNFPSGSSIVNATAVDTSSKTSGSASEDKNRPLTGPSKPTPSAITHRPSKNLDVHKHTKRLSNASSLAGNVGSVGVSASPKNKSLEDHQSPGKGPTRSLTNPRESALPHPQAPTVQPNLVIPTFSSTFDRPPRSFPPLPPSPPSSPGSLDSKQPQHRGLTAATTGLAWKALGAVGSYVYGGSGAGDGVSKGGWVDDEAEKRGRKEGRKVGRELPRRIGLEHGGAEDGWKDVKRVVVVGVHGWFPAKMLNSVIGEPTGTSVKFANMMGQAVKQFFAEKGMDESDLRLTLMPLEGEGTIESRVDKLYKAYLSNPAWINDLRRADAIFFAAHSQGCIVTTHLISRMIAQGHIRTPLNAEAVARCEWAFGPIGVVPSSPRSRRSPDDFSIPGAEGGYQKVAMLAMCGVHLGPMYSISTSTMIQPYLQWFENAAARELFEFQDTSSAVSVEYQRALGMVLENEVRVVLLASLNDQVVPIYGSSFSTATHPLLLRALYVDGASYTQSDFMTNLLCFAFMLRNAGINDQRLVEHLSEATAGSLTGIGHSTPYEELGCYTLAVHYLFYAGRARQPMPPLQVEPFSARDARNDYELPWIMRALVDSAEVQDLFPGELRDLKEGILHWKPVTKPLKEIKRRLEPMAGRQSRLRPLPNSPSSASLASTGANVEMATSPAPSKNLSAGLRKDW